MELRKKSIKESKLLEDERSPYYRRYWLCGYNQCLAYFEKYKFESWYEVSMHTAWHAREDFFNKRCRVCRIKIKGGTFASLIEHMNYRHIREYVKCKGRDCRCVFGSIAEYEEIHLREAVLFGSIGPVDIKKWKMEQRKLRSRK